MSLHTFMRARFAARDSTPFLAAFLTHLWIPLHFTLARSERAIFAVLAATDLAAWLLSLLLPPRRYAALRWPAATLVRISNTLLVPLSVNMLGMLSITHGAQPAGGGSVAAAAVTAGAAHAALDESQPGGGGVQVGAGLAAAAAALGTTAHALVTLCMLVCWLHTMYVGALGWQQPPLQHLVLQATTAALLAQQSPTACQHYIALHPSNAAVVRAVYTALQQAASLCFLGSRLSLSAAAQASSNAQKCEAVVWSIEASLGFVLPTLLVWRSQLGAAQKYVRDRAHAEGVEEGAEAELQRSQYSRVCAPVLRAARMWGWALNTALAALLGFGAAVLWQQPAD